MSKRKESPLPVPKIVSERGNQRMSELVTRHAVMVLLLQRFGIPLGFGERSVAQVCTDAGVDTGFFLLVTDVYVYPTHNVHWDAREQIDMSGLVAYLRKSHDYYLHRRLPHIESHLRHITDRLPSGERDVLLRFFAKYGEEVRDHFAHEERQVYPHVERLQRGESDSSMRIADFARTHGNLEEKLSDLLQIVVRYLHVSASSDDVVSVIYDIMQLSHDLNRHSMIEEKLLVPYVQALEQKVGNED